ncbi:MAG TPA: helix-turn-helix transcriptional regulator [Ktedonobacteraceae bacterium]
MPAESSHQVGQTVGARLRAARLAKKYTQNQLARPDFSVSYISAIERGQIQPSLRALEILARRLEVSTTELLPLQAAMVGASPAEIGLEGVGNEERETLLLESRLALYQREAVRAIELLRKLLPQKGERHQEKASELYYVLGRAYLAADQLSESEQMLAEAARLAREASDPLYPCILSLQNTVYTVMHNTEQAQQIQRESMRVLAGQSETGANSFFLAQLHSSLAQHYSHLGAYEEAREQFQLALQLLHAQNSCQQVHDNYRQLFADYLNRELYALARLYSHRWLLEDFRCQLAGKRSEIAYALGRALLRSKPEEARAYVLEMAREAESRQDQLSLAGANVQLAFWMSAQGELEQAAHLVSQAQEQVEPFGETLISADAQLLAGELAYKREDFNQGDLYFESGLELLERLGAREELVEQLARYAQLLEGRNCIQKALIYWKRAYENQQEKRLFSL